MKSTMDTANYDVSARGYLRRARCLLEDGSVDRLFYSAFELRAGLEARASEYLAEWEHIPSTSKKAWQIGVLDKAAQRAFAGNKTVADLKFSKDGVSVRFLYTPVRPAGRDAVARLNNYLHAQKKHRNGDEIWWSKFRETLAKAERELAFSVSGTLLGPALIGKNRQAKLMSEVLDSGPPALTPETGQNFDVAVKYHPAVGFEFPSDAYVWRE
ncbi:hypothetical protein BrevBR_11280 [Brevundimonas sp. BR2-1]|uniref:hypothetical protein n=1 Tax=Brevundimonas sp. BR2-1 TaxID=3031123 RepID=UPI00309F9A9A